MFDQSSTLPVLTSWYLHHLHGPLSMVLVHVIHLPLRLTLRDRMLFAAI